jgi:hypothetical protein
MLEMRTALYDPDPTVHFPACVYFRKSLAIDQHPPLDLVHACGVVPRLVELLSQSLHNIQYECAWFLTNMACGKKHILEDLLATNLVPIALKLMVSSSNEDVRYSANELHVIPILFNCFPCQFFTGNSACGYSVTWPPVLM